MCASQGGDAFNSQCSPAVSLPTRLSVKVTMHLDEATAHSDGSFTGPKSVARVLPLTDVNEGGAMQRQAFLTEVRKRRERGHLYVGHACQRSAAPARGHS
jgi:hypothetical protein